MNVCELIPIGASLYSKYTDLFYDQIWGNQSFLLKWFPNLKEDGRVTSFKIELNTFEFEMNGVVQKSCFDEEAFFSTLFSDPMV